MLKKISVLEDEKLKMSNELYNRVVMAKIDYNDYISMMENSISTCRNELALKKEELDLLKETKISVRMGDLLEEISILSGISRDDLNVKLETNLLFRGFSKHFDKHSLYNRGILCSIHIEGKNLKTRDVVNYITILPIESGLIQNEDGSLGEHCTLKYEISYGERYTRVIFDQNIDDIVFDFSLMHLVAKENLGWYPANLFTKAVVNCDKKKNIDHKKRSRTNNLFKFKKRG